ncbi:alpha-amylase family glycosyl hydrolase [Pontibacter beigongshangensis]|uniref:alpha-amylase family glycosyl hydrolase n=1 Tax=Pontibacter beigongshangensis TaxID=2574733 RepID=UPI00164F8DE8|nr:alpha-amylase family glycosyl hydrolase [Pontibacter beigongshangensis]
MKKNTLHNFLLFTTLSLASACSSTENLATQQAQVSEWPRGVTYEIFVQSFCDSDGDSIGDIKGMTARLDYLQDLGVGAVWLMPISPSPSYHKYDVVDYYGVHPDYGTKEDFQEFVRQAHQRDIKVVIDLVLNHSGVDHPWFQSAKSDPNSPYRDYYVWAHKDDPETQTEGKILAGDSDNVNRWHEVKGNDYRYYGYFYGGMPDLNFDNPKLREEVFTIGRHWLTEMGVDGFRLDAARHIFPDDRPEDNHQWWVDFKTEMQKVKPDVYLVGEVWADAETVGPYTKGLHALFNFDMGYAITNAVQQERADSLVIKHKNIRDYYRSINPDFIDATFLTNHDQNRIMSELNGDINKARMAAALLFTLPGAPYIYYGEEIGMKGKKPDELIREPFIWEEASKDGCRTKWVQAKHSTEQAVVPAAAQAADENSLLNHYKTLIRFRNNSKALTYGEVEPLQLQNPAIAAFTRRHEEEDVLVLHNLSGTAVNMPLPENLKTYTTTAFQSNEASFRKGAVQLPAYSTLILRK